MAESDGQIEGQKGFFNDAKMASIEYKINQGLNVDESTRDRYLKQIAQESARPVIEPVISETVPDENAVGPEVQTVAEVMQMEESQNDLDEIARRLGEKTEPDSDQEPEAVNPAEPVAEESTVAEPAAVMEPDVTEQPASEIGMTHRDLMEAKIRMEDKGPHDTRPEHSEEAVGEMMKRWDEAEAEGRTITEIADLLPTPVVTGEEVTLPPEPEPAPPDDEEEDIIEAVIREETNRDKIAEQFEVIGNESSSPEERQAARQVLGEMGVDLREEYFGNDDRSKRYRAWMAGATDYLKGNGHEGRYGPWPNKAAVEAYLDTLKVPAPGAPVPPAEPAEPVEPAPGPESTATPEARVPSAREELDALIKENESAYRDTFLRTRTGENPLEDPADASISQAVLNKIGGYDEKIQEWNERMLLGDRTAYDEMFVAAQNEYLRTIIGDVPFSKMAEAAAEIERKKNRNIVTKNEGNKLIGEIDKYTAPLARRAGWNKAESDRLFNFLKSKLVAGVAEEGSQTNLPKDERGLRDELARMKDIGNLDMEDRMVSRMIENLTNAKSYDLAKIAADRKTQIEIEKAESRKKEMIANSEGIPKNDKETEKDNETEWRNWARARMSRVLTNGGRVDRGPNGIFSALFEDHQFGGKRRIDGSDYMPADLVPEINGRTNPMTGRVEVVGAVENVEEMGKLYAEWKSAHKSVKAMSEAMERKVTTLPNSDLNVAFLNKLTSENGAELDGGSKHVAKAISIYWAMAHAEDTGRRLQTGDEARAILEAEGLQDVLFDPIKNEYRSLYNKALSPADIDTIRGEIAQRVGGTFYDNLGFMYAGFFGISAYGSNSTTPAIANIDGMGALVHTEFNTFRNEDEETDSTKKANRWLPDHIANDFIERAWVGPGKDSNKIYIDSKGNRSVRALELSAHPGNLQYQVGKKERNFFYLVRKKGTTGKFVTILKIGGEDDTGVPYASNKDEVDKWWKENKSRVENEEWPDEKLPSYKLDETKWEELSLEQLIKDGRIDELDWSESDVNVFGVMGFREAAGVKEWKLFTALDDDVSKFANPDERRNILIERKGTISTPLQNFNRQTKHRVAYLWLHTLIQKNRSALQDEVKKKSIELMVDGALEYGLITKEQRNALNNSYGVTTAAGVLKPFKEQAYRPDNLVRSILGGIGIKF